MSKKQKTTTKPWKEAQPYILGAADSMKSAYADASGNIQQATDFALDGLSDLYGSLTAKYKQGDANLNAAKDYNTKVLQGEYLGQNPYIDDVINRTTNNAVNSAQAALSLRGLTGGSSYADIISKNAANVASDILYNDYGAERDRMATAAGQAPSLSAAEIAQVAPILQSLGMYTDIANDPLEAAALYSGSVSGLLSPYTQTTQKQGAMAGIGNMISTGLGGWAMGGFKLGGAK